MLITLQNHRKQVHIIDNPSTHFVLFSKPRIQLRRKLRLKLRLKFRLRLKCSYFGIFRFRDGASSSKSEHKPELHGFKKGLRLPGTTFKRV